MKMLSRFLIAVACATVWSVVPTAGAATVTWSNLNGGNYDTAANWYGGVVPTAGDSVVFTDLVANATITLAGIRTNANVTINLSSGSRDVIVSTGPWWVTNTFNLGVGATGAVNRLTGGTIVVTNSAGTATFNYQGIPGAGPHFIRDGGTLIADHFYTVTNGLSGPLYQLYLSYGTLTTKGNSEILASQSTRLAALGNFTWNILGGTNYVGGGGDLVIGSGAGLTAGILSSGTNAYLRVQKSAAFGGNGSYLVVSNGGRVSVDAGNLSLGANGLGGINGLIKITGSNSIINVNGQTYVGQAPGANTNTLIIEDGGTLAGPGSGTSSYVGYNARKSVLIVRGAGSTYTNYGILEVGGASGATGEGLVVVSNGGAIRGVNTVDFGYTVGSYGEMRLTGPGSIFTSSYLMNVGSNAVAALNGTGVVTITDGAIFEGTGINVGNLGAVTNFGGTFQFTGPLSTATITAKTPGTLVLTNGIISFRATASATPLVAGTVLTNMTFQGLNSLLFNAATNAAGLPSYTFDNAYGATNYQRLILTGANPFWQSAALTIGGGGELIATNSTGASIGAVLTNAGTVRVVNSVLTYLSNVVQNGGSFITSGGTNQFNRGLTLAGNSTLSFTSGASRVTGLISNSAGSTIQALNTTVTFQDGVTIGGLYYSDPSTNIFATNVTVTASGALFGSNGDLFVFNRDLTMQSTNRTQFNLVNAAVLFTNGTGATGHTLDLTSSGALDKGSNWLIVADLATNFAIGTLSVAPGNTLSLTGGVGNALYVGTLDLQGLLSTNDLASRLWLGVNLYYDEHVAGNAYLNSKTYDLPGAGLLIPIPEPTPLAMGILALAGLALRRRRLG